MKRLQLVILFILIFNTVQALVWNGSVMPFRANGVDFGFVPYVTIVQNNHDVQLQFQTETQAVGDGYLQKLSPVK